MWVSFRSQLRGSSGLVPLSLTVSPYFKKFGQPPAKKLSTVGKQRSTRRNILFPAAS
jgi:hypothetical protein